MTGSTNTSRGHESSRLEPIAVARTEALAIRTYGSKPRASVGATLQLLPTVDFYL